MREINPSNIRFPENLKKKIVDSAKTNRRSLNSEVIFALEEYYSGKLNDLSQKTDGELVDELIRRWGRDAVYIQLGKKE